MLSTSKTIDSEIWLSIIENREASATDNRLILIIVTSLVSAVTYITEIIIEYDVNQQWWCIHDFNIFVTVNSVILRKCWKNFSKIVMHLLWWLFRRKKIWSKSLFCDINILKVYTMFYFIREITWMFSTDKKNKINNNYKCTVGIHVKTDDLTKQNNNNINNKQANKKKKKKKRG